MSLKNNFPQIILVEDDPCLHTITIEQLEAHAHKVIGFKNVDETLGYLDSIEKKFLLITDLNLDNKLGTAILDKALDKKELLLGSVLISGNLDMKRIAERTENAYKSKKFPYYELEKPFSKFKLLQIINRIIFENKPYSLSEILANARKTLRLSVEDVVAELVKLEFKISTEQYISIESDKNEADVSAAMWFSLCALLCIDTDSIQTGYDRQEQLARTLSSINDGQFAFKISGELANELTHLTDTLKQAAR